LLLRIKVTINTEFDINQINFDQILITI